MKKKCAIDSPISKAKYTQRIVYQTSYYQCYFQRILFLFIATLTLYLSTSHAGQHHIIEKISTSILSQAYITFSSVSMLIIIIIVMVSANSTTFTAVIGFSNHIQSHLINLRQGGINRKGGSEYISGIIPIIGSHQCIMGTTCPGSTDKLGK